MYFAVFSCRNDAAEMQLKLAEAYLKLGEIGMETGIACLSAVFT